MTNPTPTLTDEQREAVAGVWNALCVLIADHPMWIGDDGEPLDYSPEREARIHDFIQEATDALAPLIAGMVADAERRAKAEAWDFGYACGLGDYGKSADETCSANPYREKSAR